MTDTLDDIICPACGKTMKKIYLSDKKFCIDICTEGCGGVFFDNTELKKIDNIEPVIKEIEGKNFIEVDENITRTCPVCGHPMVKNYSSHLMKIQIDECYTCGGIFLDNNELQKVKTEFKSEKERADSFTQFLRSKLYDRGNK